MKQVNTKDLRKDLTEVLGEVHHANEVYSVTRNGKEVALIYSRAAINKLIEDVKDGVLAQERLNSIGKRYTIEEAEKESKFRSSSEWNIIIRAKYDHFEVLDPDGWDRNNWNYSWFREEITIQEFRDRLLTSTVSASKEAMEYINSLCNENMD